MATIKDIAKTTGLSIATVSKYLNGGSLKERNRAAIEEAVKKLDYKVNALARGLKTNRTMTVGICLPLLENLFFTRIVSVIEEILSKNGYSTIVCDYREDTLLETERLRFLADKNVDGIVFVPTSCSADMLRETVGGIPVVLLDRAVQEAEADTVIADNINAAYRAVEELITLKHERIGIIAGPSDIFTAAERLEGYERALRDYGIKKETRLIKAGDYKIESGYLLLNELLDTQNPPTAVFVTNYEMTVGAMIAVNERNVSLPEELSFIGYDNLSLAQITKPPLSIVSQPMEEIGKLAAETLLKRLKGDYGDFPVFARLETKMTVSESVSKIARE